MLYVCKCVDMYDIGCSQFLLRSILALSNEFSIEFEFELFSDNENSSMPKLARWFMIYVPLWQGIAARMKIKFSLENCITVNYHVLSIFLCWLCLALQCTDYLYHLMVMELQIMFDIGCFIVWSTHCWWNTSS